MIIKKKIIDKVIEFFDDFFVITYMLIIIRSMVDTALYSAVWPEYVDLSLDMLIKICVLFAVIKLYYYYNEYKIEAMIALGMLIVSFIFKNMGINDYLYLVIPIVASFKTSFSKLSRAYLATVITILIATATLSILGFIPNYYEHNEGRFIQDFYSLGFTSHNSFAAFFLFASFAYLYLIRNCKHKLLLIIGDLLAIIFVWYCTGSNTSTVIGIFVCVMLIVNYVIEENNSHITHIRIKNLILKFMIGMPLYGIAVTIAGVLYFNAYQYSRMINTLVFRYQILCAALEKVGVSLPFQTIDSTLIDYSTGFNILTGVKEADFEFGDILYGQMLLRDGLIILVPYLIIHLWILYRLYAHKEYELFIICVGVSVTCCFESLVFDIAFSIFELLLFASPDIKADKYVKDRIIQR